MGYKPIINEDKCVGCGSCVDICPAQVLELQDGKAVAVREEDCLGCESCMGTCDNEAVVVEED